MASRTELSVTEQRRGEFRIVRRLEEHGVVGFGIYQERVWVAQLWIDATLRAKVRCQPAMTTQTSAGELLKTHTLR